MDIKQLSRLMNDAVVADQSTAAVSRPQDQSQRNQHRRLCSLVYVEQRTMPADVACLQIPRAQLGMGLVEMGVVRRQRAQAAAARPGVLEGDVNNIKIKLRSIFGHKPGLPIEIEVRG